MSALRLFVPEPEDIKRLTTSLKELVSLGLRIEASVVRDKLDLPDREDDSEVLRAHPPDGPARSARCPGC